MYEKPIEEKISAIRMFREEGNILYRSKEFREAISSYQRAITYLDYAFGESEAQDHALDEERFKCHLNLAAVRLETEDYHGAINDCRIAVNLEPSSFKAFYRRGLAHLRLGELEESQSDLYKAMKLAQGESRDVVSTIENAVRELNVRWREYRQKSAAIAKAAIS